MTGDETPADRYQFATHVDIRTALDRLGVEHLEVDDARTIVIFDQTILDTEITDGHLESARTLDIDVFDPPSDSTDPTPAALITEIGTIAETDWHESHADP